MYRLDRYRLSDELNRNHNHNRVFLHIIITPCNHCLIVIICNHEFVISPKVGNIEINANRSKLL